MTELEEHFLRDDYNEIDLRAMAFKRHRRAKEDKEWNKRRNEAFFSLNYYNDVRYYSYTKNFSKKHQFI